MAGKRKKLFYKMKEVCEMFNVEPHILRYWEKEFPQFTPTRNNAQHRTYGAKDLETIRTIKHLLHERGFTIKGARRAMSPRRRPEELTDAERISILTDTIETLQRDLLSLQAKLNGKNDDTK